MAASPAIAASLLPKAATARTLNVRSSVGAVPPPPLPRLTRRRNYLRRKLLKTLTKPSPETLTLPQAPAEQREIGVRELEFPAPPEPIARESENTAAERPGFDALEESEAVKGPEFVEVSVPEGSGVVEASPSGLGWVSARSFVRLGAFFVGVFILQAIVRLLVVDSADSSDKRRRRRTDREEVGINGEVNTFREKIEMKNGTLLHVNEAELEAKIAEIRMMAMEAKEREMKNSGDSYLGSDDDDGDEEDDGVEDDVPRPKSGIEREIDGRLTRVRRGLNTVRENSQGINVNFVNKPKPDEGEKGKMNVLGEKGEDKTLMFEKKYKFRNGDSSPPREKPKGFQGSDRIGRNGSVSGKANGFSRADMQSTKAAEASAQFQAPKEVTADESLPMDMKKDIQANVEQNKGNVQESTPEPIVDKATRPRMSGKLDPQNIGIEGGKPKTSRKHAVPLPNDRSKGRRVGSTPSSNRGDSKKTGAGSELWWLNLPYLFAIAMQQADAYGDEGGRGFYSLEAISDDPTQTQASYTVLFQDRGDAHNFSHILESYFEELEDVSISVIPLPIKELNAAVKSQTKKVIVVRKGQLRLYAGQPLDEVETAL